MLERRRILIAEDEALIALASPVPAEVVDRFGAPVVCPKPMPSDLVATHLARLLRRGGVLSLGSEPSQQ